MEFCEVVESRRSVRKFKKMDLSEEEIKEKCTMILDFACKNSPSWKNSQTHRYYCAISKDKIEAVVESLSERNRAKCNNAIALFVTAFVRDVSGFSNGKADNEGENLWGAYDLALSDSLLLLKAREMGLDTLIMGLRDSQKLRKIFGISENEQIMSVISLGSREENPTIPQRKDLSEIVCF